MRKFTEGEVYFRVTYPDKHMLYPLVESFVFIGKDLSPEDPRDSWYFQFAESYGEHGSVLETSKGDRKVCCLSEEDAQQDMLDGNGLSLELKAAEKRRSKQSSKR